MNPVIKAGNSARMVWAIKLRDRGWQAGLSVKAATIAAPHRAEKYRGGSLEPICKAANTSDAQSLGFSCGGISLFI